MKYRPKKCSGKNSNTVFWIVISLWLYRSSKVMNETLKTIKIGSSWKKYEYLKLHFLSHLKNDLSQYSFYEFNNL